MEYVITFEDHNNVLNSVKKTAIFWPMKLLIINRRYVSIFISNIIVIKKNLIFLIHHLRSMIIFDSFLIRYNSISFSLIFIFIIMIIVMWIRAVTIWSYPSEFCYFYILLFFRTNVFPFISIYLFSSIYSYFVKISIHMNCILFCRFSVVVMSIVLLFFIVLHI